MSCVAVVQLSGMVELRCQLGKQLQDANALAMTHQAELDCANQNIDTLTAHLEELRSQLASSSEVGGSLRTQNCDLLAEVLQLRWGMHCRVS